MYRTVLSDVIVVLFEKQRAALETKSQWSLTIILGFGTLSLQKKEEKGKNGTGRLG